MRHTRTASIQKLFKPVLHSRSVQAAMMILKPGGESGEKVENEHPLAEQWLFVITSSGVARVGKRTIKLSAGSLLLIEKGEPHQIRSTGRSVMRTINFYSPPAYRNDEDVRPSVKK